MIDGRSRKTALVEAAFGEVADVGFEGLRLRRVAAHVGIDQSTLHHHFATKAALIETVCAYTTTRLAGTARPPGSRPPRRSRRTCGRWPS